MKRIRNPRYAPEFLERKLCPSGYAGHAGASAQYSTPDPAATQDVAVPSDSSPDTVPAAADDDSNNPEVDDLSDDPGANDPYTIDLALIGPPLIDPDSNPSFNDPALASSPANDPGFTTLTYADPGSDDGFDDAPDPGPDDPSDDPDPGSDDPSDDPSDPDVPEPPDAIGGNPPGVPLPPIPIGPAVPA